MNYTASALILGIGATLATDAWALVRGHAFGTRPPDYGLVGRWFAYMVRGRLRHDRIGAVPPVAGELLIGWSAHYLVGITFAGLLLANVGPRWLQQPTPGPALAFGIATVAAPFLVMQPAMGAGFAASRTPRPGVVRMHSLLTHAVFGSGLYASAVILNVLSGE